MTFILIFRLIDVGIDDSLGLAVAVHHLFAPENIVLLELGLEPLVDLILSLGALYNIQPVRLGPLQFWEVMTSTWSPF